MWDAMRGGKAAHRGRALGSGDATHTGDADQESTIGIRYKRHHRACPLLALARYDTAKYQVPPARYRPGPAALNSSPKPRPPSTVWSVSANPLHHHCTTPSLALSKAFAPGSMLVRQRQCQDRILPPIEPS
ncbi:unnamed protein product [Clonostachys solani]|uniref:Uncharacterized protein n=1 Tax=Clonostachys solani TaxID=160281 RepID=A0A9N9ZQ69_9HYPO|nr:unnamed protein product [Clonostachys solani]